MKSEEFWSVDRFAKFILDVVKKDNQVLIGVAGETGRGKSTFLSQVFFNYGQINGVGWGFENMTWSRDELMTWIDGNNKDDPVDPVTNCRPGQRPEYSALMPDELIHMFFTENRFDKDQQKAIMTLNMSRDRHLVIGGGVPNFWDLDSRTRGRFTFYVYIKQRGLAWVFEKEDNAFASDQWNKKYNEKVMRNRPDTPSVSPNYLCSIRFDDWEGDLREKYYAIRNKKRLHALAEAEKNNEEEEKLTNLSRKWKIAFGNLCNNLGLVFKQEYSDVKIQEVVEILDVKSVRDSKQFAVEYWTRFKK